MPRVNLMIVQGGGPTTVFNTSLAEIIVEAQRQPSVARIMGARFGIKGLIHADIADMTDMTPADLAMLRQTPGAALGSIWSARPIISGRRSRVKSRSRT